VELNAIIGDIPSGLPTPDGTQRIHNAGRLSAQARNKVVIAHNRLNDYLSTGIVPEDFREARLVSPTLLA